MGLDIYLYQQVKFVCENTDDVDYEEMVDDKELHLFFNNKGGCENMAKPGWYSADEGDHVVGRAYSGHNRLRAQLAELIGMTDNQIWNDPKPDIPFVEFINFSDCEGSMDTEVCAELSKDFIEWKDKALAHEDSYFVKWYLALADAYKTAAENNGVIQFS